MKKVVLLSLLSLVISTSSFAGRCTGDKYCTACKNCKYCKHCSKNGGSCGVCKK